MNTGRVEPAGLYLHIPFCSAICPYCDFAVNVGGRDKRQRFVEALLLEIARHESTGSRQRRANGESRQGRADGIRGSVDTIYFGGGTPSLLEPEDLARLLDAIQRTFRPLSAGPRLSPSGGTQIFFEANPEDVNPTNLAAWRRLGIGTLTLGVQSFDDDELRFLGRRHDAATARRSIELALAAGFDTVSFDLIYGLPDQSIDAWQRNLEQAIALGPDHLSCYELEVHRRTTFGKRAARGELEELPDDAQAELFLLTHRHLAGAGYEGYEVSNFARDSEHRSRHNRKYWYHTPYLGLGPSAHSFDGERRRWWNERQLPGWQRALRRGQTPEAGSEILETRDLALETIMLALRTAEGIDLTRFKERFGFDLAARNRPTIERAVAAGLLCLDSGRLAPTLRGLAVADGLAAALEVDGCWSKRAALVPTAALLDCSRHDQGDQRSHNPPRRLERRRPESARRVDAPGL